MKRKVYSFISFIPLCLILSAAAATAQTKITGKVTDENNLPLPGAIVIQPSTQNRVPTDVNGNYSITLKEGAPQSIEFNYIGYIKQTIAYSGNPVINASLKPSASNLDEVVVVGYTSQVRGSITGAVGSVSMSDAVKRRVPDVSQVLQGQVAGVQVTQSTGAPGDPIEIRIRGMGTIGNNNPLYIIDGIPATDLSFVNPQEIESMNVLKDASAAAVYGSRAASGVVLITTKKGKAGRTSIDLNYFNGIQSATNLPKMLNTQQYLSKLEEAWNNSGYTGTNPYTADKSRTDLANTNWLDELFETGHSQNLQVSASGGSEKTQYLLSTGYYRQNGIVIYDNDKYQRLNFRVNINSNLNKRLRVGSNLQLSNESRDRLSSRGDAPGIIRHALLRPPVLSVYKDPSDPTYSEKDPFTDLPFYKPNRTFEDSKYEKTSNPVALAYFTDDNASKFKTFGNAFVELGILSDQSLKFRSNVGLDLNFNHTKAFYQNFGDDDGTASNDADKGLGRKNRPNSLAEDRGDDFTITWNNTLTYDKTLSKKHRLNALVGSEFIRNTASSINASRTRFEYDDESLRYMNLGGSALDIWNGGSGTRWSLFSLFSTASYSYDEKYLLTANFRADASSRFGKNNHWGYFPSVSAGWVISRENFMQNVRWISNLKLRLSTGALGNQQTLGNYDYVTLYKKVGDNFVISRYGNDDLKWESTTQHNAGIDLGLFSQSVSISADYFIKNTTGILLPVSLPKVVGNVDPTVINAGEIQNKGFELGIGYRHIARSKNLPGWSVNANVATLTNEVKKLHPNYPYIYGDVTRTMPGHPLNAYYGYVMDGIYQNRAEINAHLFGTSNTDVSTSPGDIRFKDLNGDGMINENDRTFIGNSIPKLTYGFNFSATYKGFDLSLLVQGVGGVDRYNDSKKILDYDTRPFNHTTAVLSSWNGEGSTNSVPRVTFRDNGGSKVSSVFVEDASYTRLKNLEAGYSFGTGKATKLGIQNLRLYVSGQNLFTITDYHGLDPESTDVIDMGTYPQSRAFLFGVNVTF